MWGYEDCRVTRLQNIIGKAKVDNNFINLIGTVLCNRHLVKWRITTKIPQKNLATVAQGVN
jgi:hypothetical protein